MLTVLVLLVLLRAVPHGSSPREVVTHRREVDRTLQPQGSSEHAPAHSQVEAVHVGMHPGTTTGQPGPRIRDELDHPTGWVVRPDRDHAQQP